MALKPLREWKCKSAAKKSLKPNREHMRAILCSSCKVPVVRSGYCRECARIYRRIHRKTYYTNDETRKKRAARNAARKLPKEPCESCGAEKAEVHHINYESPPRIRWYCKS